MSTNRKRTPARERYLAKLNAHVERVAKICAIGDACCREIESLGRQSSLTEASQQQKAAGRLA